ncbi:MAG: alpha-N-arabinofuranosidase, partial [Gemmatimonadota bacterium]
MKPTDSLLAHTPTTAPGRATLKVNVGRPAPHTVPPHLFGKFCEHLGANIYQGMEAQILLNPTFGRWRFSAGDNHPDGGVREESDRARIEERIAHRARGAGWPEPAPVREAYFGGGAFGWFALGPAGAVRLSPEVGPHGGRAQRVEVLAADAAEPAGIGQWVYLPLHRTRGFELRLVARAVGPCSLEIHLAPATDRAGGETGGKPVAGGARARLEVGPEWQSCAARLQVPASAPAEALYRLDVRAAGPVHFALDRALLYPEDHVAGADPDVIRMLREAGLPLLRWPGGNFVSGYHWRDGVGPVDERPTKPNPAWEGLEFNLFGTAEFVAFCRAVGCEPMVCVNAGDGTAEEAAAWVQYCNGGPDTAMGRLRAEHGYREPFGIHLWEVGNEVYGRWQVTWTTAAGYVDRYRRFAAAMQAADPAIRLLACGEGNVPEGEWNQRLVAEAGPTVRCIADHILTGGRVEKDTDPVDLFQAFMGYPTVLTERYAGLRQRMRAGGMEAPRMAITELQLFAHFHGEAPAGGRLTPAMVPTPDTQAEALSLALIVHACIRLGDFVELLTHSAAVNHGGGLRKQRERVWANPVHWAHALTGALGGGTPVAVELGCGTYSTTGTYGHIP